MSYFISSWALKGAPLFLFSFLIVEIFFLKKKKSLSDCALVANLIQNKWNWQKVIEYLSIINLVLDLHKNSNYV